MKKGEKARERSLRAIEMLGSAIDVKVSELTESNRQLKRKIFDLYTIFEISRDFNSVLNYQTLVDSLLLTSLGQVGASTAALYLPADTESKTLTLAKSKGFSHSREAEGEVDLGGRLAAYLATIARPITIAKLEELFPGEPEKTIMERFREGLVVPLVIKSELKGVSLLGSKAI